MKHPPGRFVVMGVSGCGKTTVAEMLAACTGGLAIEGDRFHPPENRAKMAAGTPLTDADRWGWLDALNRELRSHADDERAAFLSCSALRQVYRNRLSAGVPGLRFIYLQGSRELIRQRMESRKNHFMPATLLDSQFATLEEPSDAIIADIADPLPVVVEAILQRLSPPNSAPETRA